MSDTGFKKHDEGKLRWSLVPMDAVGEIGRVLMFGARKYSAHNWALGCEWSRCYDAAIRHLAAFWAGDDDDPESGLCHLAHAGCCILFLLAFKLRGLGTDDRYRPPQRTAPGPTPAATIREHVWR